MQQLFESSKAAFENALNEVCNRGLTPFIAIAMAYPGVVAPKGYDNNGVLILNLDGKAVRNYEACDDAIHFSTRFGGVPHDITVPYGAIGMVFPKEHNADNAIAFRFAPQGSVEAASPAPVPAPEPALSAVVAQKQPPVRCERPTLRVIQGGRV